MTYERKKPNRASGTTVPGKTGRAARSLVQDRFANRHKARALDGIPGSRQTTQPEPTNQRDLRISSQVWWHQRCHECGRLEQDHEPTSAV